MKEQAQKIWDKGNYLISIRYRKYRISLYSLGTDFYEIFYNPYSQEVEWINLADQNDMIKYLNRIKLNLEL
jgi:hypothetical protein